MMNLKIGDSVIIVNYDGICKITWINDDKNQIKASDGKITFICGVDCIVSVLQANPFVYDFRPLKERQRELMKLAADKSAITIAPVGDIIMWLLAEAGEALNEAKFFKYCRKVEVDRDKLLEELTDCLFMFLELDILTGFSEYGPAKEFKNEKGMIEFDKTEDVSVDFAYLLCEISLAAKKYKRMATIPSDDYKRVLFNALLSYMTIIWYYEFTCDEISAMYNKKYDINVERLMSL